MVQKPFQWAAVLWTKTHWHNHREHQVPVLSSKKSCQSLVWEQAQVRKVWFSRKTGILHFCFHIPIYVLESKQPSLSPSGSPLSLLFCITEGFFSVSFLPLCSFHVDVSLSHLMCARWLDDVLCNVSFHFKQWYCRYASISSSYMHDLFQDFLKIRIQFHLQCF